MRLMSTSVVWRRLRLGVLLAIVLGIFGCSSAASSPTPSEQADEVAALRRQVAAQGTRLAALETRVAPPQQAATATIVPAVAGLVVDGNTRGPATAKVTITEYLDYL